MLTRRVFVGFCALTLVSLPVLGCLNADAEPDVSWFLSETEMMAIGKSYDQNSFSSIANEIVLINGWVLTLAEAAVCKKKYLKSA